MNRIADAIAGIRVRLASITPEAARNLDEGMALTTKEHFDFQELQAQAHASGALNVDEAQLVYVALGIVWTPGNGGWHASTDLATKVVVTQLMSELLAAKLKLVAARRRRARANVMGIA